MFSFTCGELVELSLGFSPANILIIRQVTNFSADISFFIENLTQSFEHFSQFSRIPYLFGENRGIKTSARNIIYNNVRARRKSSLGFQRWRTHTEKERRE